ncbi:hypothetical protein M8C21_023908 [Ambrosia artemisiifolia]|uniref:Uncharacterized protein n=1 Tax=Ambrosia artemisiifolia TaxID=4212 RepID=A0AAD5GVG3_AMBAR|nr:hypothetical protein M8C21_023908 [Ambrosia artemisiifolia]
MVAGTRSFNRKDISLSGIGDALSEMSDAACSCDFVNGQHSLKGANPVTGRNWNWVKWNRSLKKLWFGVSKLGNRLKHEINNGGFDRNTRLTLALDEVDSKVEAVGLQDTLENVAEFKCVKVMVHKSLRTLALKYPGDVQVVQLNDEYANIQLLGK